MRQGPTTDLRENAVETLLTHRSGRKCGMPWWAPERPRQGVGRERQTWGTGFIRVEGGVLWDSRLRTDWSIQTKEAGKPYGVCSKGRMGVGLGGGETAGHEGSWESVPGAYICLCRCWLLSRALPV